MKDLYNYILREKKLLSLLILIHGLFLIIVYYFGNIYTGDSDEYLQTAVNIKNHGVAFNFRWEENHLLRYYSLRPPLYGIFILLCKTITRSDYFIIILQNIISIGIWLLLLKLFPEKERSDLKIGVVITILFFPAQLILINTVLADLLIQLFVFLSLWFVIDYSKTRKLSSVFLYNLLLTMAVATKPVLVFFWVPNLIFSVFLYLKNRNILVLIFPLLLPLFVFLWSLRNESKTGYFHFSSIKTQNILELYAGGVVVFKEGEEAFLKLQKQIIKEASVMPSYKLESEYIVGKATQIIKNDFPIYVYTHAKGMINFMISVGRNDINTFFPGNSEKEMSLTREIEKHGLYGVINYLSNINLLLIIYLVFVMAWNIFLLGSCVYFLWERKVDINVKIYILMVIFYMCFVCGSAGYARFKMPILPLMLFTVPFFLTYLKRKFVKIKKTGM